VEVRATEQRVPPSPQRCARLPDISRHITDFLIREIAPLRGDDRSRGASLSERRGDRRHPAAPVRHGTDPERVLANRVDVRWVKIQVGHADSKMTLDVYAQLQQRAQREHGVRFDALVRDARVQLHGAQT
jgi:hypothetical protein